MFYTEPQSNIQFQANAENETVFGFKGSSRC